MHRIGENIVQVKLAYGAVRPGAARPTGHRNPGAIRWRDLAAVFMLAVGFLLLVPSITLADGPGDTDKSGVSPQVISLPSGPGSIEGIGESFEPDLSTGTASYPVKLTVAPGVAGFQPEIALVYNGGNANGSWGIGWRLDVRHVQRQTDEGLPSYDDAVDRFIYGNGEKLVSLDNGDYRFENEGEFMRFRRLAGGGWEAHTPDGTRYIFGESAQARVTNSYGIFRWHLERQEDTHGNEIRYAYLHDSGYAYLSEIHYNFSTDGRYNAVILRYEPRADVLTDRTSRAPISITQRCTAVEVWALGRLVRVYRFSYSAEGSTGRHSLLETITQVGDDGSSELPPFTFDYTQFDPAAYAVVSMQNPPPLSLASPDAELVDITYDGLPDVVYTPVDGHRFYLNRGNGGWQAMPEYPAQSPPDRLSSPSVRMADMDGNGQADLLVKAGSAPGAPFYYYAGQPGQEWEASDRIDYNLNPGFSLDDPDLCLFDANNDKRVDLMLTTNSYYFIWLAHEDDTWSSSADFVVPALAVGTPLVFSNPHVRLGDMTGDRLQDMVYVQDGLVAYFPHNGNGDYGAGVYMTGAPQGIGNLDEQILVGDLNNDGLDDLVLVGNANVHYWINRGDDSFAPETVLTGTPYYDQSDTTVRLADMDGDGASEVLYSRYPAPVEEVMQYVDVYSGTQPLLLGSIDNGLGRTIHVEYQPATAFYVADWDVGEPWTMTLPFPMQVVSRVTVHDANSGDEYVVDYVYRDGYFDGNQKEFRGFAQVEKIEHGDETAATTITRYVYDTGVQEESRKGLVLEKAVLGEGGQCTEPLNECYRREVNQLATRTLYDAGEGQRVSYSFINQADTYLHENLLTPVELRQAFDRDDYGNLIQELNYGQICGGDPACGDDEILEYTLYALNTEAWIVNKPSVISQTNLLGEFVSEARLYYDGGAYQGLPLGLVERSDLSRREECLGPLGGNRFVPTQRQAFDAYGNVTGILDANDHLTTVEYDVVVHTFPMVERLYLDDGQSLAIAAAYHFGFGKITTATDFNGLPSIYTYDTFGRLAKIVLPGDTLALPTEEFAYVLGSPRSYIVTARRKQSGQLDVLLSVTYFDGLGRTLQTRAEAEDGQFVVDGALTFNARQGERDRFLPYFDDTLDYVPPNPTLPHTTLHYDAMARVVRTINPDGTFASVAYYPLAQVEHDEEDNTVGSAHYDTPKTLLYDGLERLIGVQEVNHVDGELEVYTTTYRYDPLGNLTQIMDAQDNVKTMQYDALSRKVYMDDPDRGEMVYEYDDAGNLVQAMDAKGQIVRYTYDAVNRPLAERWILSPTEVYTAAVYHYDGDLWPLHRDAQNTLGQVTYIEDQAGQLFFSYDARGNVSGQIRRFDREGLEFVMRMAYDAMGRLIELTYSDGLTVTYEYNAQALLERIPGYVDDVDYVASGQRASITYANGVITTYNYDDRLRLQSLQTTNGQAALQDLAYGFDNVSNIVSISDSRPDHTAENDQTQVFAYDDRYRLTQALGTYGQIDYSYDSIGNMVYKASTAADPHLNLGEMRYGENGAGPHALTFAAGETYNYDANGNLAQKASTAYTWDYRDRLTMVDDGALLSAYVYDADGQRVRKTVSYSDMATTTLYFGQYAEVRGNQLVQYVFDGDARIAQVTAPFAVGQLDQGFGGTAATVPSRRSDKEWYVTDHLGGASLLTDESGDPISEIIYYPYGLTRYERSGNELCYQFTGKELDETALYYYGARYYDPGVGSFTSVDPLLVENPTRRLEQPGLLNLYSYVQGNPIRNIDPSGSLPIVSALVAFVLETRTTPLEKTVNAMPVVQSSALWAAKTSESVGLWARNTALSLPARLSLYMGEDRLLDYAENPTRGSIQTGKDILGFFLPEPLSDVGKVLDVPDVAESVYRMLIKDTMEPLIRDTLEYLAPPALPLGSDTQPGEIKGPGDIPPSWQDPHPISPVG